MAALLRLFDKGEGGRRHQAKLSQATTKKKRGGGQKGKVPWMRSSFGTKYEPGMIEFISVQSKE